MKKYRIETICGTLMAQDCMNQLARNGWRVIGTTYDCEYDLYTITFEKDV